MTLAASGLAGVAVPGNLPCVQEKGPKGQHRFLTVDPAGREPDERARGGWGRGGPMQTQAGGVGAARCLTIFASHLNSHHGRDDGQPTTEDDFCQPPSSLTQTWRSGTRMEGRRPRRRPTAWAPADRGQPSHCHLRMASPRRRRSAPSLGNGAVPWRPTGRRAAWWRSEGCCSSSL